MSKKDFNYSHLGCSFCGKNQREVKKLIAGPSVYICDECIKLCTDIIEQDPEPGMQRHEPNSPFKLPKPQEVKAFLDQYVVGQDYAKKVLSVALYNHYKRIGPAHQKEDVEIQKSNVLLIGPTGTGKTLLAQSLARLLDVPFCIADATSLTEAGYVGEDVENIISNLLLAANNQVDKAERGIIYIDEIDKIGRKSENPSITRDVSGEGVQQALLKLIEGTKAHIPLRGSHKKGHQNETVLVDTSHILFICGGSFSGIESLIMRKMSGSTLGFGANQNSIKNKSLRHGEILRKIDTQDLVKFGMIPEFIGRVPVIATLDDLTQSDFINILSTPKNAIIKQYQKLFEMEGVKLTFSQEALIAIANKALEKKSGARGLRSILEHIMLDIMYDIPYIKGVQECFITKEVIEHQASPVLSFEKEKQSA